MHESPTLRALPRPASPHVVVAGPALPSAPARRALPLCPATLQYLSVLFFGGGEETKGLGCVPEHRRDAPPLCFEVDAPKRVYALYGRVGRSVCRVVAHDMVAEARIATCVFGTLVGLDLREAPQAGCPRI